MALLVWFLASFLSVCLLGNGIKSESVQISDYKPRAARSDDVQPLEVIQQQQANEISQLKAQFSTLQHQFDTKLATLQHQFGKLSTLKH